MEQQIKDYPTVVEPKAAAEPPNRPLRASAKPSAGIALRDLPLLALTGAALCASVCSGFTFFKELAAASAIVCMTLVIKAGNPAPPTRCDTVSDASLN